MLGEGEGVSEWMCGGLGCEWVWEWVWLGVGGWVGVRG